MTGTALEVIGTWAAGLARPLAVTPGVQIPVTAEAALVQGRAPLISTGGVSATRLASNYDSGNDLTKRLEDAGCAVDRSGLN